MNIRIIVVCVFFISFLITVFAITVILVQNWQRIDLWERTLYIFTILQGFCMFLIAYWVYEDAEDLEWLAKHLKEETLKINLPETR